MAEYIVSVGRESDADDLQREWAVSGELVHCKDCVKRGTWECRSEHHEYSVRSGKDIGFIPDDNWYCADGERKDA